MLARFEDIISPAFSFHISINLISYIKIVYFLNTCEKAICLASLFNLSIIWGAMFAF